MTLATSNPLLQPWDTPYGLPPFASLQAEHFKPAFDAAFSEHRAELDAIASNRAPADFDNTVAAFDRAGRSLARLDGLFYNLTASETSPALQAVERELAGPVAAQFATLGVVLVIVGLLFDSCYALVGAGLGRWLERSPSAQRVQQWLFGSLLIGFALRLTFVQQA